MLCNNLFTLLRCCRSENSANYFGNNKQFVDSLLSLIFKMKKEKLAIH